MKTIEPHNLGSWDDYRSQIQAIRDKYGLRQTEYGNRKNTILFRGHANACWPIETTLERCTTKTFDVSGYVRYASRCSSELESLTGKKWDIPSRSDLEIEIQKEQGQSWWDAYLPCYDYLVYLRHHGFPSPLLDWTTSPYIAAYFAYCDRSSCGRVAVYAYIETPTGGKTSFNTPTIKLMGPYVSTHSRHFAQKAWYTIATECDDKNKPHIFCSHSDIFARGQRDQDVLIKITMPSCDRIKALTELNDYNINHFTLFQTEDALVKAMALKVFELEGT